METAKNATMERENQRWALSVRQPWAWLIVNRFKPIENRTWYCSYRGPLWIHAAQGMTKREYCECVSFLGQIGRALNLLPDFEELERGGIVGCVEMIDCIREAPPGEWFTGPWGFLFSEAKPTPFEACKGRLGVFRI